MLSRLCGTVESKRSEKFEIVILQKVQQAQLSLNFMQQHSFCLSYAVCVYWKAEGSS